MRERAGNGKTPGLETGYMGETSLHAPAARMPSNFLEYVTPFAVVAVAVVLIFGLVNMMRGGPPTRSQQLMRLRVILQFVAVVIGMTALYFSTRH